MTLFRSRFSKSHEKQAGQKGSRKPSRAISTDRTGPQHRANQARSLGDGTICEAQEIEALGYREDDEWVCSDTKCPARMIPCAWKGDKEYKTAGIRPSDTPSSHVLPHSTLTPTAPSESKPAILALIREQQLAYSKRQNAKKK